MSIVVEFFGIPRLRAGTERVAIATDRALRLSDILRAVSVECPKFAVACLQGDQLREGFLASIDGEAFTQDDVLVDCGKSILIMSADAGG